MNTLDTITTADGRTVPLDGLAVLSRTIYEQIEVEIDPQDWPKPKEAVVSLGYAIIGYLPGESGKWIIVCRKQAARVVAHG